MVTETALLAAHSGWRWAVLAIVLVALGRGLNGSLRGGPWTRFDRALVLVTVNALNLQVLLGVFLWLVERRWRDGVFLGVIHPLVMLLALGVVHFGAARARRARDTVASFRVLAISLLVALVLITAAIPPDAWTRR